MPPAVTDEAGLLQSACGQANRAAAYVEHSAEKLVGHRELVGLYPILSGEQPTGTARLRAVVTVTGRVLDHLVIAHVHIAVEQALERTAAPDQLPERRRLHPKGLTRELADRPRPSAGGGEEQRQAYHALIPDRRDLDARAVFQQDDQG